MSEVHKQQWGSILLAFLVSILAIYQKVTGNLIDNALWSAGATRRVVSFFGYPNAVALYLGPLVMLFFGYLKYVIAREPGECGNLIFRIKNYGLRIKDYILSSLGSIPISNSLRLSWLIS